MIGFVEYLISKGYKPYRKVMSKKGSTYVEDSNIGFYSSMSEHIDLRLIKGKKEVVYGLHERGHSPTLIYPRPKWVKSDADMDRLFLNYSFEEIAEEAEELAEPVVMAVAELFFARMAYTRALKEGLELQ